MTATARGDTPTVTVATLTYRRAHDLRDALPALVSQVARVPGAGLLVVDNDAVDSARATVAEAAARERPGLVRYVHEPTPGIAAARNRALVEAGTDLLVFIDDDERPSADWLSLLLGAFAEHECVGVVGPVISIFDGPVDPWVTAGRFFERLRHPTGTVVPVAATNNLLLDLRAVRRWGVTFDQEFGLTGGSDTVFTLELAARGGRLVWCDEAVVHDVVPANRNSRSWVSRRAFRMGNSASRAAVHVAPGPAARLGQRTAMAGRGAARVVAGAVRAATGLLVRREEAHARGTRTLLRGAGMLSGALGYVYGEYRRAA